MKKKVTYKTSGVDIDKANVFVKDIQRFTSSTMTADVIRRKGSFGALYGLDKKLKQPVLVSSTDGVGTKLLLAKALNKHDTVGIDLVAMNVNDILCVGARPLFFLDYIACGKLQPKVLRDVVKGIAAGCRQSGSALIGGETAEMPGMYKRGEYDLAGFSVGVIEKGKICDGSAIRAGDIMIGLPSTGLHSNGFSLARKVFSKKDLKKWGKALLAPTRIYVKDVLPVLDRFPVRGMAHITGGAYYEKLTKILPPGKCFAVRKDSWPVPDIFRVIQERGGISDKEMYRTFNMGIGFVLVVGKTRASEVMRFLKKKRVRCYEIGEVVNHSKRKLLI